MTPVYYNSNDYYKKMLELQRRLRRSEEERIRLEERFALLEHESRSRHETCINRLRMRYIEFLEEQQARDERNHRLLGALDRVDSSLALISAKTDRLGTMRRQYEAASLFKNWYANRRGNGSVAGDSGVASQTNDGRVSSLHQDRVPTFKPSTIPKVASRNVLSVPTARSNYSFSKDAPNSSYDPRRMRSDRYHDNSATVLPPSLPPSFRRASVATDPRDPKFPQSPLRYRSIYPRFSSPIDSAAFGSFRDPIETQRATRPAGESRKFERSAPAQSYSGYLENDSRSPPIFSRFADSWSEDIGEDKSEEYSNRIGDSVENELERYMSRIPELHLRADRLRSPPIEADHEQNTSGDLLNVTLSDDDVEFSRTSATEFGNLAAGRSTREPENRVRESRASVRGESASPEETGAARDERRDGPSASEGRRDRPKLAADERRNHPSASDERRERPNASDARRDYPKFDDGAARARDELEAANEGIASLARNGISAMYGNNEDVAESREDREIDASTRGTRQARPNIERNESLKQTDRDEARADLDFAPGITDEKLRLLSGEEREAGNNFREYAESLEPWNIGDLERKVKGSMVPQDDLGRQFLLAQQESTENPGTERRADLESRTNVSGSEFLEDNLKVDEFARGDEEPGSSAGEPEIKAIAEVEAEKSVIANEKDRPSENYEAGGSYEDRDRETNLVENRVDATIEYGATEGRFTNEENALYSRENYSEGANEPYQGQYQAEDDSQNNEQYKGEPDGQQYSYDVSGQQYQEGYDVSGEVARYSTDPGQDYVTDTNHPYVTDTDGQYVADANHPYVTDTDGQYATDNNQPYVTESNEQYAADNNPLYVTDSNEQYVADNNQPYVTDTDGQYVPDNNQPYVTDTNEQYVADNNEPYVTDTNEQYVSINNEQFVTENGEHHVSDSNGQYAADANEKYVTDTNEKYVADPNEQYVTDPNEPYVTDPNESYVTDPNEPYITDPNGQYVTDTNEPYVADPNEQYVADTNEAYLAGASEQYVTDPNQQYPVDPNQYEEGGVYSQDANQAYPVISDGNAAYPEAQEYTATDDQNALAKNETFVAESGDGRGYVQEDEKSVPDTETKNELLSGDTLGHPVGQTKVLEKEEIPAKKTKDVIKSLLDSDTESTIERNVSNAESDFDFN